MKFVFSTRFYILFVIGLVPLSLSWNMPMLRTLVFVYDAILVLAAIADHFLSWHLPDELTVRRKFDKRFAIGDPTKVTLHIENLTSLRFHLKLKDEFPPEMRLTEPREADFVIPAEATAEFSYP